MITFDHGEQWLHSDLVLLETILRNLISNAIKFTDAGAVRVCAKCTGARVDITVSDTGPGIDPSNHEAIFEEFERLGSHREGYGLGLPIVRRLAELIAIEITLQSALGDGSIFTLSVSSATTPAEPDATETSAAVVNTQLLAGKRILVADDNPHVLKSLCGVVEGWAAKPLASHSVAEAVSLVESGAEPDFAIVDYDLGSGPNGIELLALLERNLGRSLPAVLVTGSTDRTAIALVMQSGRPWLKKPADAQALADAVVAAGRQ